MKNQLLLTQLQHELTHLKGPSKTTLNVSVWLRTGEQICGVGNGEGVHIMGRAK